MHDSPEMLHHAPASPLRLLSVGVYSASGEQSPLSVHYYWQFVYYRCGHADCVIGNETLNMKPGTTLVIPPRTPYSERAVTACEKVYLALEAPPNAKWPHFFSDTPERDIGAVFERLAREYYDSRPQRSEMIGLLLLQLELLLRRQAAENELPNSLRAVQRAERFIESNLAGNPTLSTIARAAGVAPSTLRAHFKEHRGHAPAEYMRRIRVRYALSLLRCSSLTLEAIAELSGYDSASHLSRHVKSATAMSPGAYRASAGPAPPASPAPPAVNNPARHDGDDPTPA